LKKLTVHFVFLMIVLAYGCKKDTVFYTGNNVKLVFQFWPGRPADTVFFDTVFTRMSGTQYPRSVNKQFFIVNRLNQPVKTNILLAGGSNSSYRINVDGVSSTDFKEVEIPAKDSLIAFVEVTLEANNQINPAILTDSILFNTNGQQQKIILAAYGWDAIYFHDSVISQNMVWSQTDKPYVIVNSILVNTNTTLQILQGVNVYSSPGSSIYVAGTLSVEGDELQPVIFQGDRLQPGFEEVPGQWQGIHLLKESKDTRIKNSIIKNATIGVRVDSLSNNSSPKLHISKTLIKNCSFYGLIGITAPIFAENIAIARCGANGFVGYFGGDYTLRHCTFASGFLGGRTQSACVLNNIQRDDKDRFVRSYPISYKIENCIIYGPLEDEFIIDIHSGTPPLFALIDHCLIRTKEYAKALNINNNILNTDPLLIAPRDSDLGLRPGSPVIGKAKTLNPQVFIDLKGNTRKNPADIGAYEVE